MNDRYETTRGPDHNMKVNVLRERVGNEKNWLELDVAGHGKKYLPIKKEGETLFEPVLSTSNIFGEGVKSCWLVQSNGACFENGSKKKAKHGFVFETGSFVSLHLNLNEGKMDVFVAHPNINHGMASHVTCFQGIESPVTACICATGEDQKVVQLCSTLSGAGALAVYQSACDLAHLQRGNETLFRCIDTRGVAWRDYPNMSARVAGSKGVEFGDIVRVIQSRVGTDNNWLLCHAPTIGVKFLPLRKKDSSVPQAEQEVLFVEEDASRDDSQDIAMIDSLIIEIPHAKSFDITLDPRSQLASNSARIEVYSVSPSSRKIIGSILLGSAETRRATLTVQGSRAEIRVYSDLESVNSCLSELQGATKDNDINDGEEGKSPDSSETKTNCIQEVRCPKGHPLDFVPVLGVEWICAVTQQGHGKEGGDGLKCPLGCDATEAGIENSKILSRYRCHKCNWQLCESCHESASSCSRGSKVDTSRDQDKCWGWALQVKAAYRKGDLKTLFTHKYKRWRRLTNDVWYPQADAQLVDHCNNVIRDKNLSDNDALKLWGSRGVTNRTLTWSEHLKEYETKKSSSGTAMTMSPSEL